MSKLYFEEKGEEILRNKGIRKAEFARRMGIRNQNVNILFKTKNLDTLFRVAKVLDVPLEMLIGYIEEPDLSQNK
ncbi:MAG: helix-turn-helix transcriptional regulator [Bacteroidales bacterium]|nr:helix-turn-helix transcriptional regulator [Bacteroidales bacterium]